MTESAENIDHFHTICYIQKNRHSTGKGDNHELKHTASFSDTALAK